LIGGVEGVGILDVKKKGQLPHFAIRTFLHQTGNRLASRDRAYERGEIGRGERLQAE
jgi:hypothetical protein